MPVHNSVELCSGSQSSAVQNSERALQRNTAEFCAMMPSTPSSSTWRKSFRAAPGLRLSLNNIVIGNCLIWWTNDGLILSTPSTVNELTPSVILSWEVFFFPFMVFAREKKILLQMPFHPSIDFGLGCHDSHALYLYESESICLSSCLSDGLPHLSVSLYVSRSIHPFYVCHTSCMDQWLFFWITVCSSCIDL